MRTGLVEVYAAVATLAVVYMWWRSEKHHNRQPRERRRTFSQDDSDDSIRPPLPEVVVSLLENANLCYLSTHDADIPHLCLMNFTYVRNDEVIVLTSRNDTMKFQQLLACPNVALLVHDFPNRKAESDSEGGKTYSITLHGEARLQKGESAERYRRLHLEKNPKSANFILGDNIAVFIVMVDRARICNIEDRVQYWERKSSISS